MTAGMLDAHGLPLYGAFCACAGKTDENKHGEPLRLSRTP